MTLHSIVLTIILSGKSITKHPTLKPTTHNTEHNHITTQNFLYTGITSRALSHTSHQWSHSTAKLIFFTISYIDTYNAYDWTPWSAPGFFCNIFLHIHTPSSLFSAHCPLKDGHTLIENWQLIESLNKRRNYEINSMLLVYHRLFTLRSVLSLISNIHSFVNFLQLKN